MFQSTNQVAIQISLSHYSKLIQNVNQVGDIFLDYIVGAGKKSVSDHGSTYSGPEFSAKSSWVQTMKCSEMPRKSDLLRLKNEMLNILRLEKVQGSIGSSYRPVN